MYSGFAFSTRSRFSSILYLAITAALYKNPRWKELKRGSAFPVKICLMASACPASSTICITIPLLSLFRRPALPDIYVERDALSYLNVLSRSDQSVGLSVVLPQRGEDAGLRRHVDAHSEGLRGEQDLQQPLLEQNLDGFLDDRKQSSMMDAHSPNQQWQHALHLRDIPIVHAQRGDRVFIDLVST